MKQFDLQEYLKNPEKKIVTRKGKSVRIICTNRLDDRYPVVALVESHDEIGTEAVMTFTPEGRQRSKSDSDVDLFFAPKEGWVNIYKTTTLETICTPGCVFNTKEEALSQKSGALVYVGTCKIEWEE